MKSGRSSVWLERYVRDVEVAGSNPDAPTIYFVLFCPVLYDWIFCFRVFCGWMTMIYSDHAPLTENNKRPLFSLFWRMFCIESDWILWNVRSADLYAENICYVLETI